MTPILIWNFITAVSGGYAAAHLAPQKFGKTVTALIWAAYTLALVRLSALLPAALPPRPLPQCLLAFLPVSGLLIVIFMATTRGRTDVRLFLIFSYMALQSSCAGLMEYLTVFVFRSNLMWGLAAYTAMMAVMIVFLLRKLMPAFREAAAEVRGNWGIMTALIALFTFTITTYFVFPNRMRNYTASGAVGLPLTILLFFICFYGLIVSLRNSVVTGRSRIIKTQVEMLTQQVESQRRMTEEARRSRHDLRHHNSVLMAYAEKGDLKGLMHYLEQQTAAADAAREMIYCENDMLNTVLSIYTEKARQKKLRAGVFAQAAKDLPISDPDLVAIVANLYENAIHGAEASGCENPEIGVTIHPKGGRLVVYVKNSCAPKLVFDGAFPPELQGIGISSVLATAARYGGECDFSAAEGVFTAVVLLECPPAGPQKETVQRGF